jgi:hypothetical protein
MAKDLMNWAKLSCTVALLVEGTLMSSLAMAHASFDATMKPRSLSTNLKSADMTADPCAGIAATTDPAKRTVLIAGQKFTVKWNETINHTSKYRVAFSPNGTDSFTTILMDVNQFGNDALTPAMIPAGTLQDKAGGAYTYEITVPNTPCENCSLQLAQKMYAGAGSTTPYVGCMDVRIVAGDGTTVVPPAVPSGLTVRKAE